jgi:hypothetical protein
MNRGLDRGKAEAALERAAHKAIHGTREERAGRVSSAIDHIKYSEQSRDLEIRFVSGRTYRYASVPAEVHERFRAAPSKGMFFNAEIKDKYKFRDITDLPEGRE